MSYIFSRHPFPFRRLCRWLGLAVLAPLWAETPPSPLSLEDVLTRVAQRDPRLLAEATAAQAADGRLEQAGKRPNPMLSVAMEDFGGNGRTRGGQTIELTVQASQLVERGDKPARRVALAESERTVAAGEYAWQFSSRQVSAAAAYVRALAEQAKLGFATEQLDLAREAAASVERRRAAAVATAAEAARARAALVLARAEHARAAASYKVALLALVGTWGGDASEVAGLAGRLRLPPKPPTPQEFLVAASNVPGSRLATMAAEVESRRAALALERARAVPDFTVGAGMRRLYEGPSYSFVMGASIPLVFRDDNSGNIRSAQTLVRAAEQALKAAEVEQRNQLTAACLELAAAHAQATELRKEALPAAEEACVAARRAFDQGVATFLEVTDTRRALLSLRRDILQAEVAAFDALLRAEGISDPRLTRTRALLVAE